MLYDFPEPPYRASRETYFSGFLLFTCSLLGLLSSAFDYPIFMHTILPAIYLYLIYALEKKCPNEIGSIKYFLALFITIIITLTPARIISTSLLSNPDAIIANWGVVLSLIIAFASLQKILIEARLRSIGHQNSVKYISTAFWIFNLVVGILAIKDQIDPNLDAIDKSRAQVISLLSVPFGLYLTFAPSKTLRSKVLKFIGQKKDEIDLLKEGQVWWYANNGERKGTVSREDLKNLFVQGQVNSETLVWKEGMGNWVKMSGITSLSTIFLSAPPPLPDKTSLPPLLQGDKVDKKIENNTSAVS